MSGSAQSLPMAQRDDGIPTLTPEQARAMRQRHQINRQATQEVRDIARNSGPSYASADALLA